MFNLTFTYRPDSDIFRSRERYGKLKPDEDRPNPYKNYAHVTWLVSHCGLLREKISSKLESLGVSIYTEGKQKLKMKCNNHDCLEERKKYKFYFAAENKFCQDYITEK